MKPLPNLTELIDIVGNTKFLIEVHLSLSHIMTHLTEIVLKNQELKDHNALSISIVKF